MQRYLFSYSVEHHTYTSQPTHPQPWIACKTMTHAINMYCLVLAICTLRALPLEQWIWCMERSGMAIDSRAIIYSQITWFPINTRLNSEHVWGSEIFGFCLYTKCLPVHKPMMNLLINLFIDTLKYSGTYFSAAAYFKARNLLFKYTSFYNLSSCLAEIPVLFIIFLSSLPLKNKKKQTTKLLTKKMKFQQYSHFFTVVSINFLTTQPGQNMQWWPAAKPKKELSEFTLLATSFCSPNKQHMPHFERNHEKTFYLCYSSTMVLKTSLQARLLKTFNMKRSKEVSHRMQECPSTSFLLISLPDRLRKYFWISH